MRSFVTDGPPICCSSGRKAGDVSNKRAAQFGWSGVALTEPARTTNGHFARARRLRSHQQILEIIPLGRLHTR